jgi:hypothetical protein
MQIGAKGIENMLVTMVLKENKKNYEILKPKPITFLLPLRFKCIALPTQV